MARQAGVTRHLGLILVATFVSTSLFGCASEAPVNPSFPVTMEAAQKVLENATAHPKALERPLIVVGGFMDPGIAPVLLAHRLKKFTGDERIVPVTLGFYLTMDQSRRAVINAVDDEYPSNDPVNTTEVDVIGFSLGGVAARYAAMDVGGGRRLKIHRLFTISAPLRGADIVVALPVLLHPMMHDLLPGSEFIQKLNASTDAGHLYAVYPYARLGDTYVGIENTAPPGQTPWWVASPPFVFPHGSAFSDRRIVADIVTRLRGETPLTSDPAAPIP